MKIRRSSICLAGLMAACLGASAGCASSSNRIEQYLTGFQPSQPESTTVVLPLTAELLIVLPENELGKPTTPSKEVLAKIGQRVKKELEESPGIVIRKILPPVIIPASGVAGLSRQYLIELTADTSVDKIIVAVASSQLARKNRFWMVEDQLFARMDAALVELPTGRVLAQELGQSDYVLATSYYYNDFSYPRLYYRNFTFAGPFTIVDGDPYKALGEESFRGAADQLGMKLRQRLASTPSAG
jgi:hypothetical protein